MATSKTRDFFKAKAFAKSLQSLIDSLPSASERQEIDSQLGTIINFLTDLRKRLNGIPSQEEATSAREAIDRLDSIFAQAKDSPFLSATLGIRATARRPKPAKPSAEDVERAKSTLTELETLSIDELRPALQRLSPQALKSVASSLGMRPSQRTAQETLVHQVATKITNTRGYRRLRDGRDEHQEGPGDHLQRDDRED